MTFRNTSSKHIDIRIVSLAAGLALATAAVIGGSDLLKEQSKGNSTTQVAPRIERTAQQFGTAADAVFASQGIRAPSQFGTAADATYEAIGLAYIQLASVPDAAVEGLLAGVAVPGSLVNAGDAFGIGQPGERGSAEPQFGTMADADFASR